jgi:hypothetical protein
MRKGTTLNIFPIFILQLGNYTSDRPMIILTTSCYVWPLVRNFEPHQIPVWMGASTHVNHIQKSAIYASLWWLIILDRRLTVASNVGFVK